MRGTVWGRGHLSRSFGHRLRPWATCDRIPLWRPYPCREQHRRWWSGWHSCSFVLSDKLLVAPLVLDALSHGASKQRRAGEHTGAHPHRYVAPALLENMVSTAEHGQETTAPTSEVGRRRKQRDGGGQYQHCYRLPPVPGPGVHAVQPGGYRAASQRRSLYYRKLYRLWDLCRTLPLRRHLACTD